MLFVILAPLSGLFFRWQLRPLFIGLLLSVVGDVIVLGPAALMTLPALEGPIGLAGFAVASMIASIVGLRRSRRERVVLDRYRRNYPHPSASSALPSSPVGRGEGPVA